MARSHPNTAAPDSGKAGSPDGGDRAIPFVRRQLLQVIAMLPLVPLTGQALAQSGRLPVDWASGYAWLRLRRALGRRLFRVTMPDLESETGRRLLASPSALGDEAALTQSSGWVDGWRSEPSLYAARTSLQARRPRLASASSMAASAVLISCWISRAAFSCSLSMWPHSGTPTIVDASHPEGVAASPDCAQRLHTVTAHHDRMGSPFTGGSVAAGAGPWPRIGPADHHPAGLHACGHPAGHGDPTLLRSRYHRAIANWQAGQRQA